GRLRAARAGVRAALARSHARAALRRRGRPARRGGVGRRRAERGRRAALGTGLVRRVVLMSWGLALAGLWLTGAAAAWLPRGWRPEPALLRAVALGLRVPGAPGLVTAWVVGWSADFLSAGPQGLHALLDLGAWLLTRAAAQRVEL